MDDISTKLQGKGNSLEEQEKLKVLAAGFRKLEDSRKDYILELTRKLADIHCEGGYGGTAFQRVVFPI